jgi:RNA polymerase sigma factor for flagellar operon FliA
VSTAKHISEKTLVSTPMVRVASENYRKAMRSEVEREKLIQDYLPLVKSIVVRMRHNFPDHYEMEDMYGVAVKALIVSVNHYNPTKGKSFGNYAALRIRGSLLDELRKIDSLPRANRAKARSLQATIADFEQKHNRTPSEQEICSALKLTSAEYTKLLKETQPISFVPIDGSKQTGIGDENLPLSETLDDPTEITSAERLEEKEKVLLLRDKIKQLPDPQKKILMLYYFEELRLSEIAHIFGLTEGRISQILSQTLLTLKAQFKS